MTADMITILIQKIMAAKNIAIFMHNNPDGDALGSAGALWEMLLDNYGKDAQLIYSGRISKNLRFIPRALDAVSIKDMTDIPEIDLAIAVDTGSLQLMIDGAGDLFLSARDTVKIDHHKDSDNFANLNMVEVCPSTGELIYKIAMQANWCINTAAANAMYAAIVSDTGGFQYIRTSDSLKTAAALVDLGANPISISRELSAADKISTLANASLVANAKFYCNDTLVVSMSDKDQTKALDGKGNNTLSMLLNIKGVDYVVLLKEVDSGDIHISLRGKKSLNAVAMELGGGGHEFAAGASLPGPLASARETVLEAFRNIL